MRESTIAIDWVLLPDTPTQVDDVMRQCRRLVTRRALVAAGVAVLPVPGLDLLTDIAVLLKLIPEINRAFGLTPEQVERLTPDRRVVVYKTITAGGSLLIGQFVTREILIKVLKAVGVRLTTQQLAKYVPFVGQAVSAVLTFSTLKFVAEQHIQQCACVALELIFKAPLAQSPKYD